MVLSMGRWKRQWQRPEKTEASGQGVSFSLPWVDFTYCVGDRVTGLDGRGIGFSAKPGEDPSYPKVAQVIYDFGGQQTVLHLMPARS
jgi:hypothetical protein